MSGRIKSKNKKLVCASCKFLKSTRKGFLCYLTGDRKKPFFRACERYKPRK